MKRKVIVAVSGGPDSMFALHDQIQKGNDVIACHVNYHLRKESNQEMQMVQAYCQQNHIPLLIHHARYIKGNIEAWAREVRYAFFKQVYQKEECQAIILGHHQDDVLETFLMQSEKQIIPEYYGLKAEGMMNGCLIERPYLKRSKQEILTYVREHQIPYCIDQSNMDTHFKRNQIRHEVLPHLTEFERMSILKEIERLNAEKQERICRVKTYISKGRIALKTYRLLSIEDRFGLLSVWISENRNRKFQEHIDHLLMKDAFFIEKWQDKWLVNDETYAFFIDPIQSYCDQYLHIEEVVKSNYQIHLEHDRLCGVTVKPDDFPITIRNMENGDTIQMHFGTKKVARFMVDRHIPLYLRKQWPVVVNRHGQIILVPWLGCAKTHYSSQHSFSVFVQK